MGEYTWGFFLCTKTDMGGLGYTWSLPVCYERLRIPGAKPDLYPVGKLGTWDAVIHKVFLSFKTGL